MVTVEAISQRRRKRDRYSESWWPEIIASLISLASVAAIFGCLLVWEGKPIFDWHRITPNTVVAILATVARTCNGISVSSALGQFKWIWHHKKARPLYDFALISGATTDPWDSFKLLVRTRSLSIMALGCWITLLVLAFDTFAQQIVAFSATTEFRETSSNAIPFASTWNGGEAVGIDLSIAISEEGRNPPRTGEMELLLGFSMQGAIITGLSANDTQLSQQIAASCPTGNCNWENYQSLGVCSHCNNLEDVLEKREKVDFPMAVFLPLLNFNAASNDTVTEWYLPNGLRLNNANEFPRNENVYPGTTVMTAQVSLNPDETITFQDMSTLLLSVSFLKVDQLPDNSSNYLRWADTPVSATECGLYLCIQELNTTMVNGTLHETSRAVSSKRVPGSYQWTSDSPAENGWSEQRELFNDTFWGSRTDLQLAPAEDGGARLNQLSNTNMSQDSLDSLIYYLNSTLDGGALAYRNRDERNPRLSGITGMVVAAAERTVSSGKNSYLYAPSTLSTLWLAENMTIRFANLAKSMTNSMRTTSSVPYLDNDTPTAASMVSSLEGFEVTTLAVRWEWLILPAACVILGCLFLFLAIIQTRRHKVPLWKAHAIASVLHGFERMPSTEPYDDSRLTHMERFAKGTLVSLVSKDRSARSNAWFLEQMPGGALHQGESEISMENRGGQPGTASPQHLNPVGSPPPKYAYASLAGDSDEPMLRSSGMDDGYASSHSTGIDPFGSTIAAAVSQSDIGSEQRITRKSLRGSVAL